MPSEAVPDGNDWPRHLTQLFGIPGAAPTDCEIFILRLTDPVIGQLVEKDGRVQGSVVLNSRSTESHLMGPLRLARVVVSSLSDNDRRAREAAARDLLSTYNEGWRHYQEAEEDGQYVNVSQPILTETGFSSRLELDTILVTGTRFAS